MSDEIKKKHLTFSRFNVLEVKSPEGVRRKGETDNHWMSALILPMTSIAF